MDDKAILFVGLPKDVKNEFYDVIREYMGYDRANLRKATEEAVRDWIRKKRQEKQQKIEVNPRTE